MNNHWYDPLRAVESLGSKREKIQNMGGLAAARKKHLGQYFTQDDTAAFMWQFVKDLPVQTLLDNSIGSGRLFQYAVPGIHQLFGVDIHAEAVKQVMTTAGAAGFEQTILHAGMQDIKPRNFSCALINPPFSLHLNAQSLERFDGCTTMGKLGAHTSAMSDQYALRQALKAAAIVIALMPATRASELVKSDVQQVTLRLRAVYHLPKRSFAAEGTDVQTAVMVFGETRVQQDTQVFTLETLPDQVEDWGLALALSKQVKGMARLQYVRAKAAKPAINLPVTGNNTVTVHLDGRKIRLKFKCGLTQAKVLNQVLVKQVFSNEHHRLPDGIVYDGQGRLDLMSYLVQEDPLPAFAEFLQMIVHAGGNPVPHASVWPTITRRAREAKRALTPFRRTVWSKGNVNVTEFTGTARQSQPIFPNSWVSPVIKQGEVVHFTKKESGNFGFDKNGKTFELGTERLEALFDMGKHKEGWETIHAGKHGGTAQHAILLRKRALALKIDAWLSWKFQFDDLIEILSQPSNVGSVVGWEQACGKSRLGAALILLSGVKHGLLVVESRLVQEMQKMLALLPIDQSIIHVIDSPDGVNHLKTINIISYERLRMAIHPSQPRMTYAKRMRRRIGLVIPDEAEKLANLDSDQSRALFQLAARRKIPMSGTPIANYPRDIHGLLLFVGGDATPVQPYGYRRGYLDTSWLRGMAHSKRGVQQIAEDFVVLEWATNEFMETLSKGAKREVPKIRNLDAFRSWVSPLMKRRIVDEPDVKP